LAYEEYAMPFAELMSDRSYLIKWMQVDALGKVQ
jgi:hypothetical protein